MGFVLEDILAALQEDYEASVGEHVPFSFGEQRLHDHEGKPPCIVFTHREGHHAPPSQVKGYQESARTTAAPVSWSVETLRAECRADDNEVADTLWRNLCVLLMTATDNEGRLVRDLYKIELGRFGWLTEDPNTASPMLGWAAKWQEFSLTTIVPNALSSTVSVLTRDHEGYLVATTNDEGCQCSNP